MSLETKPSRSSSPGSLRARSNRRVPSSDYASFGDIVDNSVLQSCLQGDLQDLDSQIGMSLALKTIALHCGDKYLGSLFMCIDLIKEQLERAAALQSQKILSEVVDHTVVIPEYFD